MYSIQLKLFYSQIWYGYFRWFLCQTGIVLQPRLKFSYRWKDMHRIRQLFYFFAKILHWRKNNQLNVLVYCTLFYSYLYQTKKLQKSLKISANNYVWFYCKHLIFAYSFSVCTLAWGSTHILQVVSVYCWLCRSSSENR